MQIICGNGQPSVADLKTAMIERARSTASVDENCWASTCGLDMYRLERCDVKISSNLA